MTLRRIEKMFPPRGHALQSAPDVEPVTAAELRAHMKETEAGLPDSEANAYITTARLIIEETVGLALITQTWRLVYDQWPGKQDEWWDGVRQGAIGTIHGPSSDVAVILPRYPLQSVGAVSVFDESGTETTVTVSTTFDVDTYSPRGRLALKSGQTWPVALRRTNGVQIDYVAGYGNSADAVPAPLKQAVKAGAAYLYAHRGDGCSPTDMLAMSGAGALVAPYKAARL